MKKTSYIILGMAFGMYLLIAVVAAIFYLISEPEHSNLLTMTGSQTTVSLPAGKVYKLVMSDMIDRHDTVTGDCKTVNNCHYLVNDSRLLVSNQEDTSSLSFPASLASFLQISQVADTVTLSIQIPEEEQQKYRHHYAQPFQICLRQLHLRLSSSVNSIAVQLHNLPVQFTGLQHDSLSIQNHSSVHFDSCHFHYLNVQADEVVLNSGQVDNLYLDLDVVRNCLVNSDSCEVINEYLMGSRSHDMVQPIGCKQVHWLPRTDHALLNLTLRQSSKVVLLDESRK